MAPKDWGWIEDQWIKDIRLGGGDGGSSSGITTKKGAPFSHRKQPII